GLPQAESVKGITALEQSFGAGQIGPTQVLVQFPVPILVNGNLTASAQASLEKLSQNIIKLSNVKEVTGPTRPNGIPVNATNTTRVLTVAAIFVVLLVVLGSYPLAITGILSIGLSIIWAYAATLLFFNNVLQSGVLFIIPLVLFLLLYGIGMDYNIFILTRIR